MQSVQKPYQKILWILSYYVGDQKPCKIEGTNKSNHHTITIEIE